MVWIIGFVIFLIVITIKSVLIFKYDTFQTDGKYKDCKIKMSYDDNDISLDDALKNFKIVEFETLKQ